MEFVNNQISPGDLPHFADVEMTALYEGFARIRLSVLLVFYAIALTALVIVSIFVAQLREFLSGTTGVSLVIAGVVLMALLAWFVYASTKAIHYSIRQHDILLHSGVFWKKSIIQPLNRVQHVEVSRGPIDKRYGLANVRLFSAGTAMSTFRLPGIEEDLADQIKQFVLDYQEGLLEQVDELEYMPEEESANQIDILG